MTGDAATCLLISVSCRTAELAFRAFQAHAVDMQKDDKTLVFASWVIVEPAEDIPGVWVAHWLELDVISQSDSPQDAIASITEAVAMTVVDDLKNGIDSDERRAPPEFWARLAHVIKHGSEVKISEVKGDSKFVLAAQVTLILERQAPHDSVEPFSQFNLAPEMARADQQSCAA
jgi:predicted RNase H-like HicB family nuclease